MPRPNLNSQTMRLIVQYLREHPWVNAGQVAAECHVCGNTAYIYLTELVARGWAFSKRQGTPYVYPTSFRYQRKGLRERQRITVSTTYAINTRVFLLHPELFPEVHQRRYQEVAA